MVFRRLRLKRWLGLGAFGYLGYSTFTTLRAFRAVRNPELTDANDGTKPAKRTAIVVGGGVVGLTTAYQLRQRGFSVKLLEAGSADDTNAASYGNAATLGVAGNDHTLASTSELRNLWGRLTTTRGDALASGPIDHSINAFVDPRVALDRDWRRWVLCLLRLLADEGRPAKQIQSDSAGQLRRHTAAQAHTFALAEELGCAESGKMERSGRLSLHMANSASAPWDSEGWMQPQDCAEVAPILSSGAQQNRYAGGAQAKDPATADGQGDCAEFCRALTQRLVADGCELQYNCPAHRLMVTGLDDFSSWAVFLQFISWNRDVQTPIVRGVVDINGEEHKADLVVVCAGCKSSELTQTAGLFLPVFPLRGCSMTATLRHTPTGTAPHVVVSGLGLYITQLGDQLRFTCYADMAPAEGRAGGAGPWDGIYSSPLTPKQAAYLESFGHMHRWTGSGPPPLHRRLELAAREVVRASRHREPLPGQVERLSVSGCACRSRTWTSWLT